MKKRITALALAFVMVLGTAALAAGTEKSITVSPMTLNINGQNVTPTKSNGDAAEVFAYDGATYVPLRYLSELLGIAVEWDKANPDVAKLVSDKITLPAGGYTPGTYEGSAQGFGGMVTVTLTVDASGVTDVKIAGDSETPAIGGAALETLATQIKEKGAAIDGVAGATLTSNAVKAAAEAALAKAKGAAPKVMKAGTYEASAKGQNGPVTVAVTVDATSIKAVEIKEHKETYGLGYGLSTSPIETIPAAIVKEQSLAVDSVTSATVTSAAIKAAVTDCITQAGGDTAAFITPVEKPAPADETFDVDIVVVGAGAAGLSAANAALEAGANVLLLEKTGVTGGSTTRSGGKILAAGSKWQTEQGFTDNADMMYDFLMSFDRDKIMNKSLVRQFCDNSLDNLMWLADRGVQIQDVEPIHSSITPWRVHNVKGGGGQTSGHGGQFCVPLTLAYEKAGGKILYNCPATELITDKSGAVVGVIGEKKDGGKVTVNAKNVILCTGGYAHNEEMLAKYHDFLPNNLASGVPMGNVGDGITMATAVGAKNFDAPGLQLVYVNYDCYVGIAEESGLIISEDGDRVVDEYTYQSHVAQALADADSTCGYYITAVKDGKCVEPYPMLQWGVTLEQLNFSYKADTLEELAGQINMDPAKLKATVERYNSLCAKGKDDDFGKPAEYMIPVEGETYFAFKMLPGSSVTFGGLEINGKSQVLSTKDQPIPGLYAAGEVAFTGLFDAEYPCCGMAIGSAVYFGRNAVENILAK
ncbi:MAG: FAD-dependent oxidoreductase [Oscillospiraceae bacterium]|nr:FAD-dependent oxidoreductase [Oscillospiraceae bacterium]